jgi:hypothetical protein
MAACNLAVDKQNSHTTENPPFLTPALHWDLLMQEQQLSCMVQALTKLQLPGAES